MQVKTPDIGVDKATVAEILVKVGDTISENDSLILLESDKASVEVPSTASGVVKSILVSLGDEVSEGTTLIELESGDNTDKTESESAPAQTEVKAETPVEQVAPQETKPATSTSAASSVVEVQVPDIGVEKATVAELLVSVGDEIAENDSLVLLESDKASVEVPSTVSGTIESIEVKAGDTIQEGVLLLKVKTAGASNAAPAKQEAVVPTAAPVATKAETQAETPAVQSAPAGAVDVLVPDLGVDKAAVAEILVNVGDKITKDESIVVVESDKATVEVPSTVSGIVKAIHVKAGQDVKEGILLVTVEAEGAVARDRKSVV